ncbi:MAG: calcium-binding protein [Paracoccaceae bacterium]
MFGFLRVGVTLGARFAQPLAQGEMVVQPGGAPLIRLFNPVLNETVLLALGAQGVEVQSFAVQGNARVAVTVGGMAGSLAVDMIAAARLPGAGGITAYLQPTSPLRAQAVEIASVEVGGEAYLLAARHAGSGVEAFRIGPGQALTPVSVAVDSGAFALLGVVALATAEVGGRMLVLAGSAAEQGITVLSLGTSGALTRLSVAGPAEGLYVQGITAIETVTAFGATWAIVAAAGTSSLTVLRVDATGVVVPVDHVLDELGTRFAGAVVLEVVAHQDWVFVLAAGADDGVTLFALVPGGRLVHLATLADAADLGLANVSALRAVVAEGQLQVAVLSAAEAGVTLLALPLAGLGGVLRAQGGVATGGAGRDLILDGAGADVLSGGAGADLFVLRADGQRDVIADFDPAQDRIDLTGWPFFRGAGALAVTPTATGAILTYQDEVLEIRTATGRSLTVARVMAMPLAPNGRVLFEAGQATGEDGGGDCGGYGGGPSPAGPTEGNDSLSGGAGNDRLTGGDGDDLLEGGEGVDLFFDGAGNDTILAGAGNERIVATLGDDHVHGEAGNDTLEGGAGNDRLFGGDGDDRLAGGEGDDWLEGGEGADVLSDGLGNDRLIGGAGNDILQATDGDDRLEGEAGNDTLEGGAGADSLYGGDGTDRLTGGE